MEDQAAPTFPVLLRTEAPTLLHLYFSITACMMSTFLDLRAAHHHILGNNQNQALCLPYYLRLDSCVHRSPFCAILHCDSCLFAIASGHVLLPSAVLHLTRICIVHSLPRLTTHLNRSPPYARTFFYYSYFVLTMFFAIITVYVL